MCRGFNLPVFPSLTWCVIPSSGPSSMLTKLTGMLRGALKKFSEGTESMFGSANRRKLIKKGFACPKTRRKSTPKEWMRKLESNPWMKAGIFGVFVLGLALLIFSGEHPDPAKYFLIGLLVFSTAVAQLWINHPETFQK